MTCQVFFFTIDFQRYFKMRRSCSSKRISSIWNAMICLNYLYCFVFFCLLRFCAVRSLPSCCLINHLFAVHVHHRGHCLCHHRMFVFASGVPVVSHGRPGVAKQQRLCLYRNIFFCLHRIENRLQLNMAMARPPKTAQT